MDATYIPALIRESAPGRATRMQLRSATRLSQGAALATAAEHCAEAFAAADNLLRALRDIQALPTNRRQEMNGWLHDVAGGAIDQLGNVMGAIDKDLEANGCNPVEPLDLYELHAFWESVR